MKMNRYRINYFNFGNHTKEWEVVKAKTAEDAHYCWLTQNDNSGKHFISVEALEDKDETGTVQR